MPEVKITSGEPSDDDVSEVLETGVVERFERIAGAALVVLDTGEAVRFTAHGGELVVELAEVL